MTELKSYSVWDAGVRWFHWINLLCVLGLIAVGVGILNDKALGVSNDGKILLKTIHVWIGYAFALNLLWRLIWAFFGGPHARWRAILPGGRGYASETGRYIAAAREGRPMQYLAHNPLGRIAVAVLLLLLLVMAVSGLMLAGTDLFFPPIGGWIARWVAAPGVDPAMLVPYAPQMYDKAAYAAMREFRSTIGLIHDYGFYSLLAVVLVHIIAVVATELRSGVNLISAMFSGKKILSEPPADPQHVVPVRSGATEAPASPAATAAEPRLPAA
ncbi:MAG: cytochrome b/b6 domain-containing protein [Gammaproteobacteria bacterium]